jgi:hypothetical protein
MPFVPGAEFDVFISYSWADNKTGWVANFERALLERVHVRLGREPRFWRDERELSGEHHFTDEIKDRLNGSASMVTVLSPSYFASDFCVLEREHYVNNAPDGIKIGNRFKVIKAIKLPHDKGLERKFLKDALGFPFHSDPPESVEYLPGEQAFNDKVDQLARGVKALLEEISNRKMEIYVAEPVPPELKSVWLRLRSELESKGFRISPRDRIDGQFFDAELPTDEMKSAALTVHLVGANPSAFTKRQLQVARDLAIPSIVWIQPETDSEAEFERFLEKGKDVILRGVPSHQLEREVINEAQKLQQQRLQPTGHTHGPGGDSPRASVYLICDRTDVADSETAAALVAQIASKSGIAVHLPETGRDPAILDELHQSRLADCDAVLFYQGSARPEWFVENYADLLRATRKRAAGPKPIRATGILLGPGAKAPTVGIPVVDNIDSFVSQLQQRAEGAGQ